MKQKGKLHNNEDGASLGLEEYKSIRMEGLLTCRFYKWQGLVPNEDLKVVDFSKNGTKMKLVR